MDFTKGINNNDVSSSRRKIKKYYVSNTVVPFEEDATHEFKGHKNFTSEEVPPWAFQTGTDRPSRQPVSKAINGFLNSGIGGTVYLGIVDDGSVKGMVLTQYQMDHIVASVDDLMSRYSPPVQSHRYKIKFVPCVSKNATDDEIAIQSSFDQRKTVDPKLRLRPHRLGLRSRDYCWCDKDCQARTNHNKWLPEYVIEIIIKQWDPTDPRNQDLVSSSLKLCPVHEDECGRVNFRRQASNIAYTREEIFTLTQQEAASHWHDEIKRLRKEVANIRKQVFTMTSASASY
ncbi:schlafen-like protein 2 [Tubulanus polymorphus]|uniref:schlafen-like protein 2 n=1 Tax=Tubulanus polymorphus TaxID=672921 RepID=UPI003DA6857F